MADEPVGTSLVSSEAGETPAGDIAQPNGGSAEPSNDVVAGPYINQDGTFLPDWDNHLEQDLRHPDLKNFKSVQDLARSYVHTKRLVGHRGIIPPTEKSTPQEVAEYRKAMGAPEDEKGYQVSNEGLPEGTTISEEFAGKFRAIANKYHLPVAAWSELAKAYTDVEKSRLEIGQQATIEQLNQQFKEGDETLRRDWGREYESNKEKLRSILSDPRVRVNPNNPALMNAEIVEGYLRLANLMSQDKFLGGTSAPTTPDPQVEFDRITSDRTSTEYQRYQRGDKEMEARVEYLAKQLDERARAKRGW
jgi:hypothetical protein